MTNRSGIADLQTYSEQEAITLAQNGDTEAFGFLYAQHKRRIYSLCLRMTRSRELAEELTQDTFLQVFRKITTFRGQSAFSTWLHRVAVNVVLMELRRARGLQAEVPLEEDNGTDHEYRSPLERLAFADERLEGSLDRVGLERAIAELPSGYGLVFLMHDVYGYHHSEIATLLGCSIGNTKSQLHKARLRLRDRVLGEVSRRRRRRRSIALAPAA